MTQERKVTDMEELTQKVNDFIIALCRLNIPRGGSGRMDCPACGGKETVWYGRTDYNGHIHAGCSACGLSMMQ